MMNVNNWSGKKKVFAIFGTILVIVGIIVTIFLVQRVQETRGRAEKSTTLSLTPVNQSVDAGQDATMDVVINPGNNQVNFVKLAVKFDADNFTADENSFELDPASNMTIITGPTVEDGELSVVLDLGDNLTKVITTTTKLGKIKLSVNEGAVEGSYSVSFIDAKTEIRSIRSVDPLDENVLSSTIPASITVGTLICRPNIGKCEWVQIPNRIGGAVTKYNYKVTDVGSGDVIKEGVSETSKDCSSDFPDFQTCQSVEFQSKPGVTYKCEVTAKSECGTGTPGSATSTCPTPTPTPSPSPSPSPSSSPSPSPTPNPTEAPTETPIPTQTVAPTPVPTETVVITPAPTEIVVVVTQPPTEAISTPIPTLPPTGNPLVMGGIIGGLLFVLSGLALLFL